MIHREPRSALLDAARGMAAIAVTGPRQSGKTTLCRATFPSHEYVSLEPLDKRDFAASDPRGFLARYRDGAVLDEVQRVPSLFPYLQEELDRDPAPGRYVLTGSQHFGLTEAITQSLAGRIALLQLLPLSQLRANAQPDHAFDARPALAPFHRDIRVRPHPPHDQPRQRRVRAERPRNSSPSCGGWSSSSGGQPTS